MADSTERASDVVADNEQTAEITGNHLSNGISSLLGSVVTDMDNAIVQTQHSQDELGKEIERLLAELELFTDIAEPPRLQPALEKLADARKRLTAANKSMQQTYARVKRIQAQLLPSAPQ
ncbi:hypothetical protein EC973_002173 [Apophysomyces ossiformis]|uniref:Biogenesis of lysosome-related organelles complex 1 subunit 7 n=1 Tax=Apophysomyces ossiformis TaxID=679940 RepID=A0A8H7BMZ3_9FUNG|nr:hypothetical protein EC973_002173 [Apophysomyces ossiformis]